MSKIANKIDILHKSGKTVFTTNELAAFWSVQDKRVLYVNISRMKAAGLIKAVRRGLYSISNVEIDKFELAGHLKKYSYISFETVLAKAGIIHQWYGSYFSASNLKTEIRNKYGKFVFKRLPENILNNRKGIENTGKYFIASKERAICDYFYTAGFQQLDDLSDVDTSKLFEISKIYQNKRLEKDIKKLIKSMK